MKIVTSKSFSKKIRKDDLVILFKSLHSFVELRRSVYSRYELIRVKYTNKQKEKIQFRLICKSEFERSYFECEIDLKKTSKNFSFKELKTVIV